MSSQGAAFLAGLAVGIWKSKSEISKTFKISKTFEPQTEIDHKSRRQFWKKRTRKITKLDSIPQQMTLPIQVFLYLCQNFLLL